MSRALSRVVRGMGTFQFAEGDIGPTHEDFVKPGIVYGFQATGSYGSGGPGSEDLVGNVYYFGRSKLKCYRDLSCTGELVGEKQIELLKKKGRFGGLNAPVRMVLWETAGDVDGAWETLKERLRFHIPQRAGGITPGHVTQLSMFGDNWFSSNLDAGTFGRWLSAPIEYEQDEQPVVRVAGDELLIGPVSSQFAARAVLGLIQARLEPLE